MIVTDLDEHVVMVFKLAIFGDGESKKTSYKGSYRNSARGVAGAHKMGFWLYSLIYYKMKKIGFIVHKGLLGAKEAVFRSALFHQVYIIDQ